MDVYGSEDDDAEGCFFAGRAERKRCGGSLRSGVEEAGKERTTRRGTRAGPAEPGSGPRCCRRGIGGVISCKRSTGMDRERNMEKSSNQESNINSPGHLRAVHQP